MTDQEHHRLQGLQQNSPEWLSARKLRITASDVPAALGTLGAHGTIEEVVLRKLKGPEQPTAAMEDGSAEEGPAARAYEAHLQHTLGPDCTVRLETLDTVVHRQLPFIAASPDRKVIVQKAGIETVWYLQVKCPYSRPMHHFTTLPEHTRQQVLTELAVLRSHPHSSKVSATL